MSLAFDEALRTLLRTHLLRHDRREVALEEGQRAAAVAVVVVDSDPDLDGADLHAPPPERMEVVPSPGDFDLTGSVAGTAGGPAILLTRRAATLRTHRGQWALPGGRLEAGEDPLDAALRELREELGLALGRDDCLGTLDDYPTRSGYVISPVVLWGGAAPELRPDPAEVLSVHRISFRELCRSDSPRFVRIPESDRPVVQLPVGGDLIHAPTGAVMLQFRRVAIEGVEERVDGYEQPVFAWR